MQSRCTMNPWDLGTLLDMLAEHPLDPIWERYGDFVLEMPADAADTDGPCHRFFGAFAPPVGRAFNLCASAPAVVEVLKDAIRENKASAAYRALAKARMRDPLPESFVDEVLAARRVLWPMGAVQHEPLSEPEPCSYPQVAVIDPGPWQENSDDRQGPVRISWAWRLGRFCGFVAPVRALASAGNGHRSA